MSAAPSGRYASRATASEQMTDGSGGRPSGWFTSGVNALQSRADVIVQKSLAEGFGLSVAEATWKARPVLASRVGGIQHQIIHDRSGLLLDDPSDLAAFGRTTATLLEDRKRATRLGPEAHRRVRKDYLAPAG